MDIILVPGLWLDASSWDKVVPRLEQAGHRAHALTLPGMESPAADRSKITKADHVAAVVAAIDAIDAKSGPLVVVGHSMGGDAAYAAADARLDRVGRVIFLGSEPRGSDDGGSGPFPAKDGEVPLPDWDTFDDEMVADLDDELRSEIRAHSMPSPELVTSDPQRVVNDEARRALPITMITCEYDSDQLKEWVAQGLDGTQELAELRDLEYIDLHSGHWPQFNRPDDVAAAILQAVDRD